MNLDNIPDRVWDELASLAMQKAPTGVMNAVILRYYVIYEKSSQDFEYKPTVPDQLDVGCADKVKSMANVSKNKGGYGKPWFQGSTKAPLEVRLGEEYNQNTTAARFQFLVKTGGGLNLFNKMKEACQLYIKEKLNGDADECVVQMWKVFSETGGIGRSDSCVVYLTKPYTNASVADLVEYYVWPRVKGFVEEQFEPIGFFRMGGKPFFGLNFTQTSPEVQKICLDTTMTESAGQNMGAVLGKAFASAVKSFNDKQSIIKAAKQNARGILYDLGLLSWRPDDSTENCAKCDGAFTWYNRRHHCRLCGDIFCGDCCKQFDIGRITLPVEAPNVRVRRKGMFTSAAIAKRRIRKCVA
jgi:hypothetical protein